MSKRLIKKIANSKVGKFLNVAYSGTASYAYGVQITANFGEEVITFSNSFTSITTVLDSHGIRIKNQKDLEQFLQEHQFVCDRSGGNLRLRYLNSGQFGAILGKTPWDEKYLKILSKF